MAELKSTKENAQTISRASEGMSDAFEKDVDPLVEAATAEHDVTNEDIARIRAAYAERTSQKEADAKSDEHFREHAEVYRSWLFPDTEAAAEAADGPEAGKADAADLSDGR